MKRFQVENCVQNARQYAGEEPYEHISYNIVDGDVEAENEKEAIVNALYYLADNINDTNGMYAEVNLKDESILIYNDDDEVVEYYFDFVAKEIEDYWQGRLNTVVAGAPWIDFMKPGTDKGAALQFVQQYFQVKKEETLAFGDNHNDLGMILAAGEGCAVSTARTAVKEAAKHIVGSYEEKGVIKALQELLKKQK